MKHNPITSLFAGLARLAGMSAKPAPAAKKPDVNFGTGPLRLKFLGGGSAAHKQDWPFPDKFEPGEAIPPAVPRRIEGTGAPSVIHFPAKKALGHRR